MQKTTEAAGMDFHHENFLRRSRYATVFFVLLIAFGAITVLNINTGNVHISVENILKIIFLRQGEEMEYNIIWKIRLPRILMAAILGGGLSLSGFLLQTFFENPIAGPFVLGISSGAKMVVALAMIYFIGHYQVVSSYTLIIAAFIGSLIATGFILLVSRRVQHMATLLVAGIMIGYICSAVTDFVVTFAEDSDIVNLHGWSQGSFSGMSWSNVQVAAIVVGIAAEYGRQYQSISGDPDFAFQHFVCLCDGVCGTDFLCRNCGTVSGEAWAAYIPSACRHSGDISWRGGILYVL